MDIEDLQAEVSSLFESDDEDDHRYRDWPHPRLTQVHGLDVSYLETFDWEGSTMHERTRLCPTDAADVHLLTRNSDVPLRLFLAALRLFGDSIVAYHEAQERRGHLRFYPPTILTFWSGFETFVRFSSEMLLATAQEKPPLPVANFLTEMEAVVDRHGCIINRPRYQAVLERYVVLLKYGFNYQVDRGTPFWQRLEAARDLRDYYTHLDVKEPRSISSSQVLEFIEAVLLGIIVPSAHFRRTQLLHVYNLYSAWDSLRELTTEFTEEPFFKNWPIGEEPYMFYCPFNIVNCDKFPNSTQRSKSYEAANLAKPGGIA